MGNQYSLLQHKQLLFLVFLRNLRSASVDSVEEFVQHVVKDKEMAARIKDLIENDGRNLVIVLDGYDELSDKDRKSSFIGNIIGRRVLTKCLLVVTSRPSASLGLRNKCDCRVEIVGFTEEDRLDYIESALDTLDESIKNERIEFLQYYLYSNPSINALCYIPLNMTILLCLYEEGTKELPKTQTEMYRKFVELTIIRSLQRLDNGLEQVNLDDLPHPHNVVFEELSRFAFEALRKDTLVFNLTDIRDICPNLTIPDNWNGLGLLNSVSHAEGGTKHVTYHFLHFSIQEYMTARYISKLPGKNQIQLLKARFWSVNYYNTWIMYVGITGGKTFSLKHFLSNNWFQVSTWLFNTGISQKLLNSKIKCLHFSVSLKHRMIIWFHTLKAFLRIK